MLFWCDWWWWTTEGIAWLHNSWLFGGEGGGGRHCFLTIMLQSLSLKRQWACTKSRLLCNSFVHIRFSHSKPAREMLCLIVSRGLWWLFSSTLLNLLLLFRSLIQNLKRHKDEDLVKGQAIKSQKVTISYIHQSYWPEPMLFYVFCCCLIILIHFVLFMFL